MKMKPLLGILIALPLVAAGSSQADLEKRYSGTVRPFVDSYCATCHSGANAAAQLDLKSYPDMESAAKDYSRWTTISEKLAAKQMPPQQAKQPADEDRQKIVAWIDEMRRFEARKNAGDPGVVLARRLSNAEYNYTIRDLTGEDLQPTKEFPVDPANQAGFDNSGESLDMSPSLLKKELQAARDVADHLVLKPDGIAFAPTPMLVETDRDKYCVTRILDFYKRQDTDYSDYFLAAWHYSHRAALGHPGATLASVAAQDKVSPKYLATIWRTLETTREDIGPLAKVQSMWRALPAPSGNQPNLARKGTDEMRDYVVRVRAKIENRFEPPAIKTIRSNAEPFLIWRNREYASHRLDYDHSALQVEGEAPVSKAAPKMEAADDAAAQIDGEGTPRPPKRSNAPDPDLHVPTGQRTTYETAFARFSAVFPDAFYISERGRYFPDNTRDKGRYLSAGFHNLMGYFRDDEPLYDLILEDKGRKELDELWKELDFVAYANTRTYVQFYLFESREAAKAQADGGAAPTPEDKGIISESRIMQVKQTYLAKAANSNNPIAVKALEDYFNGVNTGIRETERERLAAEPKQLEALLKFAARAYRRPLTETEKKDLVAYYRTLRDRDGLSHEDAIRDFVVSILMSLKFSYRIDLSEAGAARSVAVQPLSNYALASRLSYFLWSSMPDDELLAHATTGDLRRPEVLIAQARRMLKDRRSVALATEFGGNWLDFRRFEEHNAVDRERFPVFTNDLREAMYQEPVRLMADVFSSNHSILDLIYGKVTFVNPVLAKHYGIPGVEGEPDHWVRIDDATEYGRGGLLPMAVFLTKNAPGLRTSPVKRGHWIVGRVLGEVIPPPPAVVPELPRDEAKMELPLRAMLAKHREDPSCNACHSRFDSMGLAFEGYGPVGEKRTKDLAGRAVDAKADFPGGAQGEGLEGLLAYIREHRQNDFVDNLTRRLLAYALNRSTMLSDEPFVEDTRAKLARNGYKFDTLVDAIITSPQFLNKRGPQMEAKKADSQKGD